MATTLSIWESGNGSWLCSMWRKKKQKKNTSSLQKNIKGVFVNSSVTDSYRLDTFPHTSVCGRGERNEPPLRSPMHLNIYAWRHIWSVAFVSWIKQNPKKQHNTKTVLCNIILCLFPCELQGAWTNGKCGTAKGLKGEKEERQEVTKHSCWVPGWRG